MTAARELWSYRGFNVVAATCKRCGALVDVSDKALHDDWHRQYPSNPITVAAGDTPERVN